MEIGLHNDWSPQKKYIMVRLISIFLIMKTKILDGDQTFMNSTFE